MKNSKAKNIVIALLSSVLIVPSVAVIAKTDNTHSPNNSNRPNQEYTMDIPQFSEATVHDPSVLLVDETFYVFGSHLSSAKTTDMMNWTQVSSEVTANNPLFNNVFEELEDTFEWANTRTLWAADVRQLEDGKFYMYYNASQGDAPRAAMGLAIADDVEGPYENQGIFLKSGMWNEISPDGSIYDATVHPHAIDPHVFYDKNDQLWMVYGSYSGGIFILEMDKRTGLPVEGQGYGKHLIGGNHSRIEGAFIEYNKQTNYYYLYMTFGGLDATGGYNMRVARSKNPDGPYYDSEGHLMSDVKGAPGTLFDDRSIEPYGVKQMGNFLFERQLGEKGTGIGTGYVSPGHNSVYTDPDTGQLFMFFHTRFPQRGETHEVRVHQMFMNEDEWPVISPYRYTGEKLTKVNRQDVIGTYKYINHGKDISSELTHSEIIVLEKNNTISGAVTGRWKATGQHNIELTIEGKNYKGLLLRQWDPTAEEVVLTFSALSEEGVAVWGSQMERLSPQASVEAVYNELTLDANILNNVDLPTEGTQMTTISWETSDPSIISEEGLVNRPDTNNGDAEVVLTATIRNGQAKLIKHFNVTVPSRSEGGLVAHYALDGNLVNQADSRFGEAFVTGDRIDNTGGTITFVEGAYEESKAAYFDGQSGIRLPDGLISSNQYVVSIWLKPEEITQFTSTFFGLRTVNDWVSLVVSGPVNGNTMIWSGSNRWYDVPAGFTIPVNEWSHVTFAVDEGYVVLYVNGQVVFEGTNFPDVFTTAESQFALGVNYWDVPFEGMMDDLRVFDNMTLTEEEVQELYNGN